MVTPTPEDIDEGLKSAVLAVRRAAASKGIVIQATDAELEAKLFALDEHLLRRPYRIRLIEILDEQDTLAHQPRRNP